MSVQSRHVKTRAATSRLAARASVAVIAAAACVVLALGLPACDGKSRTPSSRSDATPTTARIVPFSPGLALLMRDMGLSDRIVGRHAYDAATSREILPVGDEGGVDQEAMLRVAPNLVFIQRSAQSPPEFLTRCNIEGRFALAVVPLLSLDDIPRAVRIIDEHVARVESRPPSISDPDSAAARLIAHMEGAFAPHPARYANAGRVLLLASVNPPAAFGPGSWHHDLLVRVGATPAITTGAPYIALDREDVLRLNPDAIILVEAQNPDATPVLTRLGSLGKLHVPAITNSHLAAIDDPYIMTPSAAMIGFAHRLDTIFREWTTPD